MTPKTPPSSGVGRRGTRSLSARTTAPTAGACDEQCSVVHGIDINILLALPARWLRATAGSLTPPGVGGPPARLPVRPRTQGAPPSASERAARGRDGWVREKRQSRRSRRSPTSPRCVLFQSDVRELHGQNLIRANENAV
jgi:hypothetical protein